ncbi:hypothetical protein BDV98DRAFT_608020 [Pterulicium gracile]|uniref:Uncharacterized protein n=1 Tax=Pterulicium gracile TaxID=1884261 RepID=A0A5C3Q8Z6_9AGAR|nr:hypothetical protein BDV98DRAFT_608020 [Pterula gracilis]
MTNALSKDITSRLPGELLRRVFASTNPMPLELSLDCTRLKDHGLVSGATSVWTLSHVCCRWREIAISTPHLWAKIMVVFPDPGTDESGEDPNELDSVVGVAEYLLRLQLERSKGVSLQIKMSELSRPHRLFDVLLTRSDRWEIAVVGIYFDGDPEAAGEVLSNLGRLSGRCSQLHTLEITLRSDPYQTALELDAEDAMCALQDLPSLTNASLKGDIFDLVSLPWSQLTALELRVAHWYTTTRVEEILSECHQLDRLGLSYEVDGDLDHDEPTPGPTGTLTTLRYLAFGQSSMSGIVVPLCMPKLEGLDVLYGAISPPDMASMIQASSCSLTTLRIGSVSPDLGQYEEMYRQLEELLRMNLTLKELYWGFSLWHSCEEKKPGDTDPLFRMLTMHHSEPNLCPILERLDVEDTRFDAEPFLAMLDSRINSHHRSLDFLRVTGYYTGTLDTVPTLSDVFDDRQRHRFEALAQHLQGVSVLDWKRGVVLRGGVDAVIPGHIEAMFSVAPLD